MGFEIELKFRVDDLKGLTDLLDAMGAVRGDDEPMADLYLSHPSRDFAQSDEALRIRRIGPENRLTYKGSKQPGSTKTREEIEFGFGSGPTSFEQMAAVFDRLGFRPVATITKSRRPYHLRVDGRPLDVCLDQAQGLGTFAEVETLAESQEDVPAAQEAVLALARALGLNQIEPRSYLGMTLNRVPGNSSAV